jgi:hypothetical protein
MKQSKSSRRCLRRALLEAARVLVVHPALVRVAQRLVRRLHAPEPPLRRLHLGPGTHRSQRHTMPFIQFGNQLQKLGFEMRWMTSRAISTKPYLHLLQTLLAGVRRPLVRVPLGRRLAVPAPDLLRRRVRRHPHLEPVRCCSPRHPTQFEPMFIKSDDIL